MNYSLKIPAKQIDTLEELVNTDMSMVIGPNFVALHNIKNQGIYDKIYDRAMNDGTFKSSREFLSNPNYVVNTSLRKNAIFFYEVPLKLLVIKNRPRLKKNIKFRFIKERFALPYLLTVATTTRFDKTFRQKVNLRLVINIF